MQKHAETTKQSPQYRSNAHNNPLQKKQQEGLATFQDKRPSTIAQTKLWDSIHNNTANTQNQGSFQFKSHYASMAQNPLQYKQNNNRETAQRMAEDEEDLLQGKFKGKAPVQRMVASEDEEGLLQGKFSQAPIQKQEQEAKPNNTGLPDKLKSGIENLSGYSMDDVNVHYNSSKPAQLQAHAYAQGTDIHLGPGQEKHLPHEAWHVVQQKQGRVKPTMQMKGIGVNDDVGLEREADVMGGKAIQGRLRGKATPIQKKINSNEVFQMLTYSYHSDFKKNHLVDSLSIKNACDKANSRVVETKNTIVTQEGLESEELDVRKLPSGKDFVVKTFGYKTERAPDQKKNWHYIRDDLKRYHITYEDAAAEGGIFEGEDYEFQHINGRGSKFLNFLGYYDTKGKKYNFNRLGAEFEEEDWDRNTAALKKQAEDKAKAKAAKKDQSQEASDTGTEQTQQDKSKEIKVAFYGKNARKRAVKYRNDLNITRPMEQFNLSGNTVTFPVNVPGLYNDLESELVQFAYTYSATIIWDGGKKNVKSTN